MSSATYTMRTSSRSAAPAPRYSIPMHLNACLTLALAAAHLFVLFVLPLLLPVSGWFALALLPFCLMHSVQWGLIHEGIHKHLHPSRAVNEIWARFLSVLLGASFYILAFGHLMHHKLNRQWQSEFVAKKSLKNQANYFFTLLGGLYITEIFATFGLALLPRALCLAIVKRSSLIGDSAIWAAGRRYFYERGNISALRVDALCIALLYAPSFWLYGAYMPLLLTFLATRALMLSFMDNLYHYATAMDVPGKDLRLPPRMAAFMLNSNYHGTHHRHPDVPWSHLPALHRQHRSEYDGAFIPHALMQFHGAILRP